MLTFANTSFFLLRKLRMKVVNERFLMAIYDRFQAISQSKLRLYLGFVKKSVFV